MSQDKKDKPDKQELLPAATGLTGEEKSIFTIPPPKVQDYRIIRALGEGGMGVVYLAEQKKPVKRRVALKVIKPGMDSKRVIARFEAEEQALALLDHPNVARVYEAGVTEAGGPYFAMEYVKGVPITEHCDREKLGIEDRLELFLQVCDAVQHAHQKGIIHRDIKPSNILVSIEGEHAVPKVIDFGVAKAVSQPLTERTLFTEHGQIIGTPEYMSPEQAEMTAQDIDTRTDIYSLGVLLYELLTGALPFDPSTLREVGFAEIQRIIREQDPPHPSARLSSLGEKAEKVAQNRRTRLALLAKRLHKELEWIPLKAMRKERTHRYRSASELTDDIHNYLNGAPLIAGPETAAYRMKKFFLRNRTLVTSAAAVLIVLVAGVVVSTIFAIGQSRARAVADRARTAEAQQRKDAEMERDRAMEAERLAEQHRTEAERQTKISQAVNDFLSNDLLASLNPYETQGRKLTVHEVLHTASESIKGRFEDTPLVEASIRATLGTTYLRLGDYKAAEPHLERAFEIRRKQLGEEHPDTLNSMLHLAMLYRNQRHYTEAEPLFLKTLELHNRVFGGEHSDTLSSTEQLAWLYILQERYTEAEPFLVKVFEVKRRVFGEDHLNTLDAGRQLAAVYHQQERYAEAESMLLKALEVQRQLLGEEHPSTLESAAQLGWLYWMQGRYAEAEPFFARVVEVRRRMLGEEHPDTLENMRSLAVVYQKQGRYTEAESMLVKILETPGQVIDEEHPIILTCMETLAWLYMEQERYAEAEPLLVKVLESRRRSLGEEHSDTLRSMNGLINLYDAWGKPEQAEQWRAKLPSKEDTEEK
jgi:serine/threonine protein kinase/Tfp pilus assembly protein PilF